MRRFISCLTAFLMASTPVSASIDNVLDNMVTVHASSPGIYKSPTMTTASLGSFSFRIRNDVLNLPLYTIRPPRAVLSCSGMDFDAGMIGLLNLDQLQNMLEQAGASLAWGIMIGLIYSLPGVADAFAKLNQWARYGQNLFAKACLVGQSIGQTFGKQLFGEASTESAGNSLASSATSTLNEAWKRIKENLDKSKLYWNFPYTYFYNSGFGSSDTDLADAIATYFGVIDFKPYDSSGNPCSSNDCLDPENIKAVILPPKDVQLSVLLDGGTITGYHCNWQLVNGVMTCKTIDQNKTINVSKGLVQRIKEKIDGIVSNILSGTPLSNEQVAFLYYFGDIYNIVNLLAVTKKNLGDTAYNRYANAFANHLAILTLQSFIDSAGEQLQRAASIDTADKSLPKDVQNQVLDRISLAKRELSKKSEEYRKNVESLLRLGETYANLKSEVDKRIADAIGKPSFIFRF